MGGAARKGAQVSAVAHVLTALEAAGCSPRPAGTGWAARCPAHDDHNPSFQLDEGDDGRALVRCHAGCDTRDVLASLGLTVADLFNGDQSKTSRPDVQCRDLNGREPAPPPNPDVTRLQRFSEELSRRQSAHPDSQTAALSRRGISREIACAYGIAFFDNITFDRWRPIENVWCIPIPTPTGEYRGVKLHKEGAAKGTPKTLWAPFGSEPTDRPRHGWTTLWPPAEWFASTEPITICEGELKAAAVLSAGRNAVSPTTGAATRWTPKLVQHLYGRRVVILYDADDAGIKFRNNLTAVLCKKVASLRAVTFRQSQVAK